MCPVNDLKPQTTIWGKKIWQGVLGQDICSCIFLQNLLGKKEKKDISQCEPYADSYIGLSFHKCAYTGSSDFIEIPAYQTPIYLSQSSNH